MTLAAQSQNKAIVQIFQEYKAAVDIEGGDIDSFDRNADFNNPNNQNSGAGAGGVLSQSDGENCDMMD